MALRNSMARANTQKIDAVSKTPAEIAAELVIPEHVIVRNIDGRDWPIVMSPHALMLAEKATGLNLMIGLADLLLKPTMEFVCAILYACMKIEGSTRSLEDVSKLVNFRNLPLLAQAVSLAGAKELQELMKGMEEIEENPTKAVA